MLGKLARCLFQKLQNVVVILAGGTGSRLGGASKADLELDGQRLLDRVLVAVADADTITVVGDVAVPDGVHRTPEDPPGRD